MNDVHIGWAVKNKEKIISDVLKLEEYQTYSLSYMNPALPIWQEILEEVRRRDSTKKFEWYSSGAPQGSVIYKRLKVG